MPKLDVIFEDNHLLVVNKPSGILVQGDKTGDQPISDLAKEYLVKKYQKKGDAFIGVPHRIDRPTSGLLVLAKTSKSLVRLNKLFHEKQVDKIYWAIVKNKPAEKEATLIHFLVRNAKKNKSTAYTKEMPKAKRAELHYRVLLALNNYYLLEIIPRTGRHHQIRSQLAAINCPIKGDVKYGFNRANVDASIHLHSRSIEFIHPVKKRKIKISASLPKSDAIWEACSNTRG